MCVWGGVTASSEQGLLGGTVSDPRCLWISDTLAPGEVLDYTVYHKQMWEPWRWGVCLERVKRCCVWDPE